MHQTPAHEIHNPDLLRIIPPSSNRLIEIGCSSGALAREFKKISPTSNYLGIEIDPQYAQIARRHCDDCQALNIEKVDDSFWIENSDRDCWIFGDTLEHLQDPWRILGKIRENIHRNGSVVACIPNAQHWSLQVKLSIGDFRYEESGLLDKTHLRWFTRQTIFELFKQTGFDIVEGFPRIFSEEHRDRFLPVIKQMADLAGADSELAISDSLPIQYVVRAVPV